MRLVTFTSFWLPCRFLPASLSIRMWQTPSIDLQMRKRERVRGKGRDENIERGREKCRNREKRHKRRKKKREHLIYTFTCRNHSKNPPLFPVLPPLLSLKICGCVLCSIAISMSLHSPYFASSNVHFETRKMISFFKHRWNYFSSGNLLFPLLSNICIIIVSVSWLFSVSVFIFLLTFISFSLSFSLHLYISCVHLSSYIFSLFFSYVHFLSYSHPLMLFCWHYYRYISSVAPCST